MEKQTNNVRYNFSDRQMEKQMYKVRDDYSDRWTEEQIKKQAYKQTKNVKNLMDVQMAYKMNAQT
jgi:hypothetical protein